LLSHLLNARGVESIILELRSKEHVLSRVRAGVIEHGSGDLIREAGLGDRMDSEGFVHHGVNLAYAGGMTRIDFEGMVGKHVIIYGQTELQKDLYEAIEGAGTTLIDEVADVQLHEVDSDSPSVSFTHSGQREIIECDFIAGCDGVHGISREHIPASMVKSFERLYPFVWIGVLSPTPSVNN
jgi:p-hydroxybenzoate 3-monooxygenase